MTKEREVQAQAVLEAEGEAAKAAYLAKQAASASGPPVSAALWAYLRDANYCDVTCCVGAKPVLPV